RPIKSPFDFGAKRTSRSKTAPSSIGTIPLVESFGLSGIYQMMPQQEIWNCSCRVVIQYLSCSESKPCCGRLY
ncbi:MAG: hypothetical protein ABGW75_02820, partial [Pirellulales bacterium]